MKKEPEVRSQKSEVRIIIFGFLLLVSCFLLLTFYWNKQGEDVSVTPVDAVEMAEIPAGSFIMGSEDGEFDERPLHNVELDSFYMDRYEVTNLQYQNFIAANPYWQKGKPKLDETDGNYLKDWNRAEFLEGKENYPVVYISWYAASAYCKWAEKSLPIESQWEYAARGGYEGIKYVWGNSPELHLANWNVSPLRLSQNERGTKPVGSYSVNGFGLNDMAGNVWEWTADGYEIYMEGEEKNLSPRLNNHLKIIRGGSWKSDMNDLRVSIRRTERPNACRDDIGFRCIILNSQQTTNNQQLF